MSGGLPPDLVETAVAFEQDSQVSPGASVLLSVPAAFGRGRRLPAEGTVRRGLLDE